MENLWQRLKPAVKKQILAEKEKYPYLVEDVKTVLKRENFWSNIPINTARQIVNFTHDSVFNVSMTDFMWGDLFIKKDTND
jgi:hypothetical protein